MMQGSRPDPERFRALMWLLLLGVVTVVGAYEVRRGWSFTHWLFSYEHGFSKRALVGEFWRSWGLPTSLQHFQWAGTCVLAVLVAVLAWAFLAPAWRFGGTHRGLWHFAAVALCCPATIANAAFDLGRFDQINMLLALGAVGAVAWRNSLLTAVVLVALMAVSILVHEAAFFMFLPGVLACWYWFYPSRATLARVLGAGGLLSLLMAAVWMRGHMSSLDFQTYTKLLTERHGAWGNADSVSVLFRNTVGANVEFTVRKAVSWRYVRDHIWMLLFLLVPLIVLFRPVWATARKQLPVSVKALLVAAFSGPLLLMAIGHDYFRWWAVALTNAMLTLAVFAWRYGRFRDALSSHFDSRRRTVWFVLAMFIAVGPLGITRAFERPIYNNGWVRLAQAVAGQSQPTPAPGATVVGGSSP